MNKYPLLSIIIPNYNNNDYLEACLKSVLMQTYTDYEIIIADDASTDGSQKIIKKWAKKFLGKIKYILHPTNQGVSQNRHSAIKKAEGDYIITLDSDDILSSELKLEMEMQLILFYKEVFHRDICAYSNTVLLNESLKHFNNEKKIMTPGRVRKEGNILFDLLTRTCFIPTNFIMPKAAYFDVGGYDFSLTIFEDWDLKIRLAAKLPFYFTGVLGYGYRQHDFGLSSTHEKKIKTEVLTMIFNKYLYLLSQRDQINASILFNDFMHIKYNIVR